MPDVSARLGLPYLLPSQAQKHVTHNEALRLLDLLVQLRLVATGAETPPEALAEGEAWGLGAAPTGAWAGQGGTIAAWSGSAWSFLAPQPGWRAADLATGDLRIWTGSAWDLPAAAPETLALLGINTAADALNRLSVAAGATLLSHEGAGHRLKVNKAAAGDTASLLFQSGFTGHAEMGLAGETEFSLKVSADGSSWATALRAASGSGAVTLPSGLALGSGSALLETYERGTWTPEAADAPSGGTAATATTASGRYTRIGDIVSLSFTLAGIDTTGLSGTGALAIRALPWPARDHASSCFTAPAELSGVTFSAVPALSLAPAGAALSLLQPVSGGSPAPLAVSALASGSAAISGSLVYRV